VEIDLDEIIAGLEQRVAARRRLGEYPMGLEPELEAEFDGILAAMRRRELSTEALNLRIDAVRQSVDRISGVTATESNVPGGAVVHSAIGRLVSRQTNGVAAGVRLAGHDVVAALVEVVGLLESQRSADERQLVEVVSALFDRLTVVDQLVSAVNEIERRLDAIEATTVARS